MQSGLPARALKSKSNPKAKSRDYDPGRQDGSTLHPVSMRHSFRFFRWQAIGYRRNRRKGPTKPMSSAYGVNSRTPRRSSSSNEPRMRTASSESVRSDGCAVQASDTERRAYLFLLAIRSGKFDNVTSSVKHRKPAVLFRIAERSAGKRGLPTHSLSKSQFQPKLNLAGTRGRAGDFGR
jgi:hypothetical protein